VNATARYRLARGVRLRAGECGEAMLLVPEGIVRLNETAAATLELIDGKRDLDDVTSELAARFEAEPADVAHDVRALLEAFVARGFVIDA
jgi:pyrroloquinoline quinone biosynthesis protein D